MNLAQYQTEAQNTKSNSFHGDKVSLATFVDSLNTAIVRLRRLDEIKKALFYGRESEGLSASMRPGAPDCNKLQLHNLDDNPQNALDIVHAIIGKATEAGELLEALQESLIYNNAFDQVNLLEEIGDGFWYDAIALQAIGDNFEHCAAVNNAKLRLRFPNKFTEQDANNRNLPAERRILENIELDPSATEHVVTGDGSGEALPDLIECPNCGISNGHSLGCPNQPMPKGFEHPIS